MRTEFLCISVLSVTSGPRVKLVSCKSALNPPPPPVVYSTDRSMAVAPVLGLLFVALWFILRGDLLYVFPCVILFLRFSVRLVLRLPRLGKRELILVLFVRLFDLCCLDLSVSSSSWRLGRAAVCDCGTFWTFPLLFYTLWCFVVYSTRRFVVCLTLCYFVLVFFSPFNIAIISLGEERANLSVFRTFERFVLVWICRFPLPLDVWEGLRFVIVALSGLFSYFLFLQ